MASTSTSTGQHERVRTAVEKMLHDQSSGKGDRRDEQRHPFFRPVTITLDSNGQFLAAFTLDISADGIRFVHNMPLEPGDVTINICMHSGDPIRLKTHIEWCECQPWGRGWYISGGRFRDIVDQVNE